MESDGPPGGAAEEKEVMDGREYDPYDDKCCKAGSA